MSEQSHAPGRFLTLHLAYEAEHPDEADMAKRYAQHAEAMFLRAHGTLDGYEPEREFPCHGALRAVDEFADGITLVRCDQCSYETTARLRPVREPEPDPRPGEPAPF